MPLVDENVKPVACKRHPMNPVHAEIVNKQVNLVKEAEIVSTSAPGGATRSHQMEATAA